MNLFVPFSELSDIIKAKTKKDVSFACVDEKTFSAKVNMFLVSPSVNIIVLGVRGNDLYLKLGDLIRFISGWFNDAQEYYSVSDDGLIVVHLDKIEQLRKALEKITIESITFDEKDANVSFHLKQF